MSDAEAVEINNRGVGLMGQFNYERAAEEFQKIVAARPDLVEARVNLMIATFNRQREGDEDAAIAMARDILREHPDHARAHYCLGLLLYRAGLLDEATPHFSKALELDPHDAYALYSVAQCEEQQGKLEAALEKYEQAMAIDPMLRSSYLRASQVNRRLGRNDEAQELLEQFERLANNPQSRLIEAKYTRMGPKAMAVAIGVQEKQPTPRPSGPLFGEAEALAPGAAWAMSPSEEHGITAISACDINGDGIVDLVIPAALSAQGADAANAVLIGEKNGSFALHPEHPLANVTGINAALWGDVDNNGLVDVYFCRRGENQLWLQVSANAWQEQGSAYGVTASDSDTIDGALVDADHDGDLDILLINAAGPCELLNNNRDGTFQPIGDRTGIAASERPARGWIVDDFDQRRDLDVLIVRDGPPHDVFLNDRGWAYRAGDDRFATLLAADISAGVAADVDADGQVEIYTLARSGVVSEWQPDERGAWVEANRTGRASKDKAVTATPALTVIDVDGDGELDAVHTTADGWRAIRLGNSFGDVMFEAELPAETPIAGFAPVVSADGDGYAIVAALRGAPPVIWRPGPGRHSFVAVSLAGADDAGQSMRSNFAGIGTRVSARIGDHWTIVRQIRQSSGPGQSLQPIVFGLGGRDMIDFVQLDWPDGLFQTELALKPGEVNQIAETQRQVSSCPVLFAWNGSEFAFITDLLGVGGIGYMVAPGEYAPSRPWERLLLPEGSLQPLGGRYVIKLAEPMEEACYLDALELLAIDVPAGWRVAVDERMGVNDPQPTGDLLFYRQSSELLPVRAVNDRGEDVRSALVNADHVAAPVGAHDARFIGRLEREHVITLEFAQPLDATLGQPVLLIDGWIEYPYSQTMFAAAQAGAAYEAPSIEMRAPGRAWETVYAQVGYPAGMPRQMALPIDTSRLPPGAQEIRIRTNQEIYWDRIAVVFAEPCGDARVTKLALAFSTLDECGYAERRTGPQRLPMYDYAVRSPFFDMRRQSGFYTSIGPIEPLVASVDGALAIFGPGEEVHAEFAGPQSPLPSGWTRRFVLIASGWCKDMDLYTKDGETIEPLPTVKTPSPNVEALHRRFLTRYLSGY